LADVALGVVSDMDQEAAKGGRQILPAHRAGQVEVETREFADAGGAREERSVQFGEDIRAGTDSCKFTFVLEDLLRAEGTAFGIGKEAIETAGDVAQVESHRGEAGRASVELRVREQATVMVKIDVSEFEGMNYGPGNGGKT
jgi:hypothetical protein